jgi:alpha-tubulin suppressor-like RCC1 family protein
VTEIQASNFGGLLISGGDGRVFQWDASASPKASHIGKPHAVSIGEGFNFGAEVTSAGKVWTWGAASPALCRGKVAGNVAPGEVAGINNAVAVSGGGSHIAILLSNGHVDTCGSNSYGQLGNGSTTSSATPVEVDDLSHIASISSGSNWVAALDSSGNVWEWGENQWGQLGDGSNQDAELPVEVLLPDPAVQVYAGGDGQPNGQTIALLKDGTVWAWGNNEWGQLGNGTETSSTVPVLVEGTPTNVAEVATGGQASYLLTTSGDVWSWGDDSKGQLGDGKMSGTVLEPKQVASGYSQISATAAVFVGR